MRLTQRIRGDLAFFSGSSGVSTIRDLVMLGLAYDPFFDAMTIDG